MSLFCGIVSLREETPILFSWVKTFRREISRNGLGRKHEFYDKRRYLLKLDVGAFSDSGWLLDEGHVVCACAGAPILSSRNAGQERCGDLQQLSQCSKADIAALLRTTRGNFSFVRYDLQSNTVIVATDRLGLRPLYWLRHGDFLVFAGALRLLHALPDLSLQLNMQGFFESVAFGFPLGDRTEYHDIFILAGGDVLESVDATIAKRSYWNWCSDAGPTEDDSPALRRKLHEEFLRAIEVRSCSSTPVYAALSGGLDSRCVVAGLWELGRDVRTVNVSHPGSMDQILARQMADTLKIPYFEQSLQIHESGESFFPKSVALVREHHRPAANGQHAAQQLWGGNDGSISVGYVYVAPESVRCLRSGDVHRAAEAFLHQRGIAISRHVFTAEYARSAMRQPLDSLLQALDRMERNDAGQRMFMFLLVEQQRKMMQRGLEDIDVVPVERIEPFFDTEFLELTCRLPVDSCIGHRLYHKWLAEFPPVIGSIPWQVYPGHEACPVANPVEVKTQWECLDKKVRQIRAQRQLANFDAIAGKRLGAGILDWPKLRLMRRAQGLRLLNGTYTFLLATRAHNLLLPLYREC